MDIYGFYTGQVFDAHDFLGAHIWEDSIYFRTFAPAAEKVVLLIGEQRVPMNKIYDGNFYEVKLDTAKIGDTYEYRIYHKDGSYTDHCDPYGFEMELRPDHKSVVSDLRYEFHDRKWIQTRSDCRNKPLNIYEMHFGSWKRDNGEVYSYRELADLLIPYLKESGYNYVEFLPLSEHPCDESWGYQNTGFFAATSRYGKPKDLMYLIDTLHRNGIGAILDFVPVHFAVDEYALARYDGTALYEYPHNAVGISEWGSYNFMHSRGEVRTFLQSAANFWLAAYHFDGLRMDAISRIIYWQGDPSRGVNNNAVNFIKVMNSGLKRINNGCMLIAEDSTNYDGVTRPVEYGGLGFDYKWDMGWIHDTLEYFQSTPEERVQKYHKLTFSMMYFHNEKYLLPFSHDEVVHGKATILQKMNGEYEGKFPQARAMYMYMTVHPGKKLNFMGNEWGQLREWDEKREQDWDMRKYPLHDSFYRFISELNKIYLSHPSLHDDYSEDGFLWADCHSESKCLYAITRKGDSEELLTVFNFSNETQEGYTISVPEISNAEILINSDWYKYSGNSPEENCFTINNGEIVFDLPPFCGVMVKVSY